MINLTSVYIAYEASDIFFSGGLNVTKDYRESRKACSKIKRDRFNSVFTLKTKITSIKNRRRLQRVCIIINSVHSHARVMRGIISSHSNLLISYSYFIKKGYTTCTHSRM